MIIIVFCSLFLLIFLTFTGFFFFFRFYLFLDRGEGREKERERGQCVVASHAPSTGDWAWNPGMWPDLEIKPGTLWSVGQCPIHWATPVAYFYCFDKDIFPLFSSSYLSFLKVFICVYVRIFLCVNLLIIRCYDFCIISNSDTNTLLFQLLEL